MRKLTLPILATAAAGVTLLAGCASPEASLADTGDEADLSIAVVHGWDEGVAVSVLWQAILEERGYRVDLDYLDIAPAFTGLATGDIDLYLDSWLPNTHADYLERYGDDIDELGVWNREGRNTIAVNADAPIDSLEELAANAELFQNRLVGADPGAGLTRMTKENAIPQYGLEGMDFLVSSSPAMLAELDGAMQRGENVVVTLWQPHWAYDVYDLKNLADPKGAMGASEEMTSFSRQGLAEVAPVATGWLADFEIDMDTLTSLETALFVAHEGDDYREPIAAWIEENRDWVDSLTPEA